MHDNPAEDWRALSENYRSMEDDELRELAADFADLTPTAQQVLRDEMKLRGLGDPQAPRTAVRAPIGAQNAHPDAQPNNAAEIEYTWKTPLCTCDGYEEAWQISEALKRGGIESWITNSSGSVHPRADESCRVLVAADQLDDARLVIERPIPRDIVEQSKIDVPEYEPPVCAKCGADDPVLESADPVNAWKCDACGEEWTDPEAEPTGQPKDMNS